MINVVPLQRRTIQDGLRNARVMSTLSAWCLKHGLEPFSVACDCGADRRTTIPFQTGGCVGLVAPVCACGNHFGPFETRALDGSLNLAPLVQKTKPRWKRRRPKVIPLRRVS